MTKNDVSARKNMVRWDADFYNSLSEEDCIICLTEREIYLVGQVIDQITWKRTRWTGDSSGLDLKAIAGNLEYKLAERMTCETLTQLATQINILSQQVQQILAATNPPPTGFDTEVTVANDVNPQSEMVALELANADVCDTDGKDAIYGAVKELVAYIHANNNDLLQQLGQDFGNIAEQVDTIISAIPIVGLLPIDEAADYVAFIANELKDEYEAIVTETLLQSLRCDLFCIAVANDCRLSYDDLFGYFADKFSGGVSNYFSTFGDIVGFALTGTFTGDEYFYLMCFLQLQTINLGGSWLAISSPQNYALVGQAGQNSPDEDWSIFCTSCPEFDYWEYYWNFAWGLGEFQIEGGLGIVQSDGIEGVDTGDREMFSVFMNLSNAVNIKRMAWIYDANSHIGNGSDDFRNMSGYTGLNVTGTQNAINLGSFMTSNGTDVKICSDVDAGNSSSLSLRFLGSATSINAASKILLKKVRIIGLNDGNGKPELARWRVGAPLCEDFS